MSIPAVNCFVLMYFCCWFLSQVPEMAFGEYWDTCEYTDGVLNYNQVSRRGTAATLASSSPRV
jgi:hypothetical protein